MRAVSFGILAASLMLAGCGAPAEQAAQSRNTKVTISTVNIGGTPYDCLNKRDVQVYSSRHELKGDLRNRLLTLEAQQAKVRVWVASNEVTGFGSTKVTYTDEADSCVLWSEGLTLQEYHQRLGQTPLGLSPFYQPDLPNVGQSGRRGG